MHFTEMFVIRNGLMATTARKTTEKKTDKKQADKKPTPEKKKN